MDGGTTAGTPFLGAYGVSCRARAKRAALHRSEDGDSPLATVVASGSPASVRWGRKEFGWSQRRGQHSTSCRRLCLQRGRAPGPAALTITRGRHFRCAGFGASSGHAGVNSPSTASAIASATSARGRSRARARTRGARGRRPRAARGRRPSAGSTARSGSRRSRRRGPAGDRAADRPRSPRSSSASGRLARVHPRPFAHERRLEPRPADLVRAPRRRPRASPRGGRRGRRRRARRGPARR